MGFIETEHNVMIKTTFSFYLCWVSFCQMSFCQMSFCQMSWHHGILIQSS